MPRHSGFHEPSLVPLADMLTNTVGVIVFILIFTVLAASGVVLVKRLPLEHSTKAKPMSFVCTGGRILPLDSPVLLDELSRKWGKPSSIFDFAGWVRRFNGLEAEDKYFVALGESSYSARSYSLSVVYTPKEGKGETRAELLREGSEFLRLLEASDSSEKFVNFLVRPDSLDVFFAARDVAGEKLKFGTGWIPLSQESRIMSGPGGREAKEQ